MAPTTGTFVNKKGQKLVTCCYPAQGKAIANLFWHHGLGEHSGRRGYVELFNKLAGSGIEVHTFDCHGHGKSEPTAPADRAVIWRFEDLLDDLYLYMEDIKRSAPPVPFFIGGQSMGALVAAAAVVRSQDTWAGLILHSAALDVEWTPILRIQAPLGGVLGNLVPRARIVPAVRPQDMSQDPQVVSEYVSDPLNTVGPVAARTGAVLLNAMTGLRSKYKRITLPVLAVHGTNDKCTSIGGVRRFIAGVSSADKTMREVEGGYHELLMGPEAGQCTQQLIDWILEHAKKAAPAQVTSNL